MILLILYMVKWIRSSGLLLTWTKVILSAIMDCEVLFRCNVNLVHYKRRKKSLILYHTQIKKEVTLMRISVWSGKTPEELSVIDRDIMDEKRFPPEDTYKYSQCYLELDAKWKSSGKQPVSQAEIARFRGEAAKRQLALAEKDPDLDGTEALKGFERLWPRLSELLKEVPFYNWVKDHAMDSAFLYTYFVELSGRSPALEMCTGYSWDITGRYRRIPECDAAYYFRIAEPTFRSFVQRYWFSQQEMLKKAIEIGWRPDGIYTDHKPRRVKVLFLGGGLLKQLRMYELNIETVAEMFDITVYDNDPDMPNLLHDVFGGSVEKYGIKYYNKDFLAGLKDEEDSKYDLVLGTGIMSYYTDPEKTSFIMGEVQRVLLPDGGYVCDLQVFEPSMARCVFVLRWRGTTMKPNKTAVEAVEQMKLAVDGTGFVDFVYEVDHYNGDLPAIVNFCMKKPA